MIEKKSYRDSLYTVTEEGERVWIYPKKPQGRFYTARIILSYFLIAFLIAAPFIKINGHPFMLLNFIERHFVIFGLPFGPHDFYLFVLLMIAAFVFLFLFTVVYGRIFCGWLCPQTVFMEMIFRRIEYWIEGDARQQRALSKAPWDSKKILKKTVKHILFFTVSFVISNIFLAWIIGGEKLIEIISDPPSQHFTGLISISIFSLVFYSVFARFREQVCTMVCPYGRLQGVMLDENSIVIAYDHIRGEPRGKLHKGKEQDRGDCIDCNLCVDVCPTGIDIRNGTQLECVNCTACIDECDTVMEKIGKPRGLIRYASRNEIISGVRKKITPRVIGYTFVLLILFGVFTALFLSRSEVELTILRTPGLLSQEHPNNKISNLYDVRFINKTFKPIDVNLKLENIEGEIKLIGHDLHVVPQEVVEGKFMIILSKDKIKNINTPITIVVSAGDKVLDVVKTSFLGNIRNRKARK